MNSGDGVSRRSILTLGGSLLVLNSAARTVAAQLDPLNDEPEVYGVVLDTSRPSKAVLDAEWDNYRLIHIHPTTGARAAISDRDTGWVPIPDLLVGYPTAELPDSPETGNLFFDENRNLPTWWDQDHYEFPTFVDDVLTSPVTVANTTTRTTVFDPDINANSLVKGRKYQIDLSGSFSTTNNSDTFTIDINLAGATDVAGIGNVGGNVTDAPWNIEFAFTVREHGQNGVLQPHTKGLFNSDPADADHDTVTVDTTTVTELSVDLQWSAADPDNSVTVKQAHLKQMG